MPFMAMHAGLWISNPLPNEQNADALADALARKRGFCECGKWVGCFLERPTAQVEKFAGFDAGRLLFKKGGKID